MTDLARGIDVSDNNGDVHWKAWANLISFGMAKATEGANETDGRFEENWTAMGELRLWRFAYHFVQPEESEPAVQAARFVDRVRGVGLKVHDHFVMDYEVNGGLSAADCSWWAYVFCREVNRLATGHRLLVYTMPSFADAGYCARLGDWHLWEASWDAPQPVPCGPWKTWAFWQYSGSVTDRDAYAGNEAALRRFCMTTG